MNGRWKLIVCLLAAYPYAAPFNYGEALQKSIYFYECQQSGVLPQWNRVTWRGNSCVSDGADVGHDLTGGWFDAGDHVKFNFPMAATVTVLAWGGIEYESAYKTSGQWEPLLRNVRFATDYLLKCHTGPNELYGQVGKGSTDHAFWGPAESVELHMERPAYKIDASNPGSDLAGETAAALAAASILFADSDPAYAATLVSHARQIYTFAETYKGKYSDAITDAQGYYNSWSGYNDELVWGAIWLHKATGEASYLNKAGNLYDNLATEPQQTVRSYKWTLAWDDKSYGCYVLMAALTDEEQYHADAQRWLDYWTDGYNGQRIKYTPGGLAWLDQWGANRYAANTAFCAFVYAKVCPNKARSTTYQTFAQNQIRYLLGDNPLNRSFVVGFGTNPPQRPHHRTCHGYFPSQASDTIASRHTLYGALVGGPGSNDEYTDDRDNYINNEVACDYNGAFTGALAAMYLLDGGTPAANFPPPVDREAEFIVEASINVDGDRFTEIRSEVKNVSAWPARPAGNLSFRYYLNLDEVTAAGIAVSSITVNSNYSQGNPSISSLQPVGGAEDIYYIEISFAGDTLYPGTQESYRREVQFRIALPQNAPADAWDRTNDWSAQDLQTGYSNTTIAPHIPIYLDGVQVAGAEFNQETVSTRSTSWSQGQVTTRPRAESMHWYSPQGRRIPVLRAGTQSYPAASGVYIHKSATQAKRTLIHKR